MNFAGGLPYHLKAWRFRKILWKPFRYSIQTLLSRWKKKEWNHLMIVGSSAGYSLSTEWLDSFKSITCIEIDLWAKWIWEKNHPDIKNKTQWIRKDLLQPGLQEWQGILSLTAPDALLFSGFMGQWIHAGLKVTPQEITRMIPSEISWASFHDRLSGKDKPEIPSALSMTSRRLSNMHLAQQFYTRSSRPLELNDHELEAWEQELPAQYLSWEIEPGYYHLMEWVQKPF